MWGTKLRYSISLASLWLLLLPAAGICQTSRTAAYFVRAALRAESPRQAVTYVDKACQLAVGRQQYKAAADYRFQLSSAFFDQSYYMDGIRQAQLGLELARTYNVTDDTLSFKYYSLLASIYSRLTMNDSARYWYHRSEQLLQARPRLVRLIPDYIEAYYYNKGSYAMRLGDQEQAAAYITKSVEMVSKTGNKRSTALSYLQLANYHFSVHQYRQAGIYYQDALNDFSPEAVDACWGYALLGNCYRAGGQLAEGLRLLQFSQKKYEQLVSQQQSAQDYDFEFESSYYRGKCEQRMGLSEDAIHSYQRCIQTYRRLYGSKGELIAASWTGQAEIAFTRKQYGAALKLVQQALLSASVLFADNNSGMNPSSDDIKAGKALYEALHLKGRIWFGIYSKTQELNALNKAIDTYGVALNVAQRIRRSFTRLESSYFFNESIHPCVEHALEAFSEIQSQPQAIQQHAAVFDLLQSYQAMGMADALHEKTVRHETIPASVLQQEQTLRQQLVAVETQLINQPAGRNQSQLLIRVGDLKRALYFFEDRLAHQYPRYYELKYTSRQLPLPVLQQKLDNSTAYLSYFTGERFLYGFLVSRSRVVMFRRVMTPAYARAVTELHQSLSINPGMFDYEGRPAANRLFDYLIRPIESQLTGIQRLIVERDGQLANIPFDVLEATGQPEAYLCKRLALSYSYSAKLTFSDTIPARPFRPISFAPYSEDSSWRDKKHGTLALLRNSAAEVKQVGGDIFLNAQATKSAFLRRMSQATLIHLATHATADDAHPEASSINFYPNTPDSLLRSLEIVNLPLDQIRLVVLSACSGNSGLLRKAEGILSMARAFRLAGCPTILTTTWSAHNQSTSQQVNLFYKHLHEGLPADRALQQARLDFLASPASQKWGHPYYWANFTLIGNPDVAFPATSPSISWIVISMLALLSIGVGFVYLRSRSHSGSQPDTPADLPAID
ncbi:CHAT domain-containing protein [Fibrella forsythiae]|uniref:CHAT domain-containing protein n=1 Tax=Fibrella forsythiae TaxID=2817061 RepID=A0ABS3JLN9_9BACT|nr:CHAT domain-containing tetratricopeptide repeat protein [Fibrella forsythiae]MBO0950918.1 CHAT domain-containing protein [Fibrella forsythiae]